MTYITVTENECNESNLLYVQSSMGELFKKTDCEVAIKNACGRSKLLITCPEYYSDIIKTEVADKVAETVAIRYKYEYFKSTIKVEGLNDDEREILMASLIAADLEDDKKYVFEKFKRLNEMSIDGMFNFRFALLKKKWEDVASYMPSVFINAQLKEFVTYLLENKRKRVYIDGGKVYDSHFKRLKRVELLDGTDLGIIREVLLSNCGEIELSGAIPQQDEYYLKEYFGDKIFFSTGYFR